MTDKFNKIIDFAIEREEEAIEFYKALQVNSEFSHNKDFYQELVEMEQGHANALRKLKEGVKSKTNAKLPSVEDLLISDYLVEPENDGELTFQDIVIIAMKREERAYSLYTKLAENSSDEEIKNIFLKLASEEAKHKNHFEKIYDTEVLTEN